MIFTRFAVYLCTGLALVSALPEPVLEESLELETDSEPSYNAYTDQIPIDSPAQAPVEDSGRPGPKFPIPHHPKPPGAPGPSNLTIFEYLRDDAHFSRLFRVVNISDEVVSQLNDSTASLTFFAVSDRDLKPPHKGHKKPHHKSLLALDTDAQIDLLSTYTLSEVVPLIEDLEQSFDDDSDKEKHKEFLKKIVRAILAYHILPTSFDIASLAANATQATNLTFPGAIGGEPQRIKVSHSLLPPKTTINLFSKVVRPNINTTNGFIHVVDHPLLPPPAVFSELFLVPSFYSFFTSALQRSGLTDALDLRYDWDSKSIEGASSVTLFAPTNRAFQKLPRKLQVFLFSPFGARVLKKLLQLHVVPDLVLYSDYIYNATSDAAMISDVPASELSPETEAMLNEWARTAYLEEFEPPHHRDHPHRHHQDDDNESAPDGSEEWSQEEFEGHSWPAPPPDSEGRHFPPHFPGKGGKDRDHPPPPPPPPHFPGKGGKDRDHPPPPPPPPHFPGKGGKDRGHPPPPPPGGPPDEEPGHPHRKGPKMPKFPKAPQAPKGPEHHPHPPPPPPPPPHHDRPHKGGPPPPPPPPHPDHPRKGGKDKHPPPPPHHELPHKGGKDKYPKSPKGPKHPPHPPKGPKHPKHPPFPRHVHLVSAQNLTLPTLLTNHTLQVHIAKFNVSLPFPGPHKPTSIVTKVFVNGQSVLISDIVGLNGAVHVLGGLIDPRGPHHKKPHHKGPGKGPRHDRPHHKKPRHGDEGAEGALHFPGVEEGEEYEEVSEWADWEDWLPQWALEQDA